MPQCDSWASQRALCVDEAGEEVMEQEIYDLLINCLGMASAALCGYLAGRQWRITQLAEKLRKEIYEQAKLDGAYEFISDTLFSSIGKRQPQDGNSSGIHGHHAEK
jgi:hypothetical protein